MSLPQRKLNCRRRWTCPAGASCRPSDGRRRIAVGDRRGDQSGGIRFSWLLAFMFYYSIALGALFLVMVHHLTDAGWSVGIRRFCEHSRRCCSRGWRFCFLPVAFFAKKFIRG
jgi:hypothetical protein